MSILEKPSMREVVEREGIQLIRDKIRCISHVPDNHPSLRIYDDHGHCFACGWHGDSIQLIMDLKGLSFPDALSYLGIKKTGKPYQIDPVKLRARELRWIYRQWQHDYCLYLADLLRWLDDAKALCITMDEVEEFSDYYHKQEVWQYEFDILIGTDEKAKFDLFKEVYDEHKIR